MRFIFASDSFKGSLSSRRTAQLLEKSASEVFDPGSFECTCLPVADGGEGTVEAVIDALSGDIVSVTVNDPLGRPASAEYGVFYDGKTGMKRAVIEMAAASGLTMIEEDKRDPEEASSYGTGELILDALDKGCRDISIAIGGSATNDGGMGCCRALGVRFLDMDGEELDGKGKDLGKVRSVDITGLDPRIGLVDITVMCDVKNPLCGPEGATMIYGPQKGADEAALQRLEAGMKNYRDVIRMECGTDCDRIEGAGAAGGLGAALYVFLKGRMRSGIETVLDILDFDEKVKDADLVITGEGRCDHQSSLGKVMCGIGEHSSAAGVRVVALCGSLGEGHEEIFEHGISKVITIMDEGMSVGYAMEHAEELYCRAAVNLFRELL